MRVFYTTLILTIIPFVMANFTYDKRNLGDYQRVVFQTNATKAIQYDVIF